MPQRSIIIGRIVGAHGIGGEVVMHSFAGAPLDIAAYGPLLEENGTRTFRIVSARQAGKGIVARLAGIADREAAEGLKGVVLIVAREQLPEPEPDEYYHADLIGLAAVDASGNSIGTVAAVHNHGASDILEIQREGRDNVLVPFVAAFVPEVDLPARRVVVVGDEEADADAAD